MGGLFCGDEVGGFLLVIVKEFKSSKLYFDSFYFRISLPIYNEPGGESKETLYNDQT